MPDDRKQVGSAAERYVRSYLEGHGYVFRHANWRYGHGELDLVMDQGDELVFVEVKARRSESAGRAEEGLSKKQQGILLRTAEMYALTTPGAEGRYWRIDLIAVSLGYDGDVYDLVHYQNAVVIG
jgi:putative endonuclease